MEPALRASEPRSPISRELFRGALRLAANRDLVDPGRDEVRDGRAALAADIDHALTCVDAVRALARGDLRGGPWPA